MRGPCFQQHDELGMGAAGLAIATPVDELDRPKLVGRGARPHLPLGRKPDPRPLPKGGRAECVTLRRVATRPGQPPRSRLEVCRAGIGEKLAP